MAWPIKNCDINNILLRVLPCFKDVLHVELTGTVGGPDEGPRGRVEEAQLPGMLGPVVELARMDVLGDLHVPLGGPHVLAQRDALDASCAEILEGLQHLVIGLPAAQHDRGLGDERRIVGLDMLQH